MGLANTLGWTGVDNFISPRRNTLTALGASLLSGRPGVGVSEGIQADSAYAIQQKAEAERQANINQTAEWLQNNFPEYAGLPPEQGWQLALKEQGGGAQPASIQEYQFYSNQELSAGRPPKPYDEWRQGSNQTVRAGLGQPVPLRNKETGETVPFMPMSDGTYINPLSQQIADETWEFDPAYIAAQRAQGTKLGGMVGDAQFDLPAAKLTMDQSLGAIADIRSQSAGMEEQFGKTLGVLPNQMRPDWAVLPGSEQAKFQVAVDRGVNRAFLEAREVLRGGGQITDFESKKAETAITNMQTAMQKGDKQQFLDALDDFEKAVKDGYAKLQAQAGSLPSVGGGAAPAGGTDLKSKYGLE
jgi:hypothetical protein